MAIEEVEILSKGNPKPVAKPSGYWEHPFELNTNPDPIWRELFFRNIPLNRDAAPVFKTPQTGTLLEDDSEFRRQERQFLVLLLRERYF